MNPRWTDLGVDSLGVLAIADIVENKYGISLDDERIAGVRTLSDFKNLIAVKMRRNGLTARAALVDKPDHWSHVR